MTNFNFTSYDPALMQDASTSLYFALLYGAWALALSIISSEFCVDYATGISQTDFFQYVELLKTCSVQTPGLVDPHTYDRILNVHPFSYFSSTPEVYHDICNAHYSTTLNDPNRPGFSDDIRRARFKREIVQPYVSACQKHSWLIPAIYVGCSISFLYIGRAIYFAVCSVTK